MARERADQQAVSNLSHLRTHRIIALREHAKQFSFDDFVCRTVLGHNRPKLIAAFALVTREPIKEPAMHDSNLLVRPCQHMIRVNGFK